MKTRRRTAKADLQSRRLGEWGVTIVVSRPFLSLP